MKRIICAVLAALLLTGCVQNHGELDRAMALRAQLTARAASFDAEITADYGDQSCSFSLNCVADIKGELQFTVTEPESIAGITGTVSATGGKLTFEDTALAFEKMADGQLSPVCGPWVLMNSLRGGYLTSCNLEDGYLHLSIDDSYDDDALHLDIWLNEKDVPVAAEIYWQGRRLLSISVSNFTMA